jgi:hypothetical protein
MEKEKHLHCSQEGRCNSITMVVTDVAHGVVEVAGSIEDVDEPSRKNTNSGEQSQ